METPFGGDTARLKLQTDVPHSRLGNGLFGTLTLPFRCEAESEATEFAMQFNFMEASRWLKVGSPMIGAWCAEDWSQFSGGPKFMPAFRFFIPNMMYRRGLAEHLVLYAMARANWFKEQLVPDAIDLPMYKILDERLSRLK
jgi:hypothetical protein